MSGAIAPQAAAVVPPAGVVASQAGAAVPKAGAIVPRAGVSESLTGADEPLSPPGQEADSDKGRPALTTPQPGPKIGIIEGLSCSRSLSPCPRLAPPSSRSS